MNVQNEDKSDMSQFYIRFQGLRFLFIDEFSTAAIEIFAEINDKTSKHIRENNTWSLRKVGSEISKRPFGGLNVVVSGDAWQFGPIGSVGAVFDNPTRMQCKAANAIIASMFSLTIMESLRVKLFLLEDIRFEGKTKRPGTDPSLNPEVCVDVNQEILDSEIVYPGIDIILANKKNDQALALF